MFPLTLRLSIYRSVFLCLACLIGSCTFEPDENFVTVDPSPKAELTGVTMSSIDLMEAQPDTIELFARATTLQATFNFNNVTLTKINVYIDGKLKQTSGQNTIAFVLFAKDYADGVHQIKLEVFTNSGTGSLADRLGQEVVYWEKTWVFSLHRLAPPEIKITKIAPQNGRLLIEWESSGVRTEKKIELKYGTGFATTATWSYTITDPNQTSLIDNRFIEGPLSVSITNVAIDPIITSPKTTRTETFTPPTIQQTTIADDGQVTLKWNRSLFYDNVKHYTLEYNGKTLRTSGGSDTILTTNILPFWGMKVVVFRTVAGNLLRSIPIRLKFV